MPLIISHDKARRVYVWNCPTCDRFSAVAQSKAEIVMIVAEHLRWHAAD